ncbi:30S ribosomal protein S8e [Candidatus Woesearchaeota archaeon]|jgi:small subunit ribosomal protein S8e|nr:30S ribosomal protein S8e [Candidatus Woesearchaeota archaeon]MBT5272076.1 30S ribosomal protein S8e [Candidatus Woesearchaeota archaeon]MBT6041826.1 30S ribosomal protein S8e [Candidatus Woesearchaeota archaeon]MBT6336799.1 30S ribosomal protein S8e [Candidatus Woesearchaeota archaeon]MBT7927666.1 30S ribosomal protein S8e [Candidatus Woesearchaeota archaeon]
MVITQKRSKRKASGGRYGSSTSKKLHQAGNRPAEPRVATRKIKTLRTIGGKSKNILMSDEFINVTDPATKKTSKVKMTNVLENTANKQYIRMNVLTKGAVVETEKGKAKITNRPAQEGYVTGVLVK